MTNLIFEEATRLTKPARVLRPGNERICGCFAGRTGVENGGMKEWLILSGSVLKRDAPFYILLINRESGEGGELKPLQSLKPHHLEYLPIEVIEIFEIIIEKYETKSDDTF